MEINTPQEFYNAYTELKAKSKEIGEQLGNLEQQFVEKFKVDLEYPIEIEGDVKHIRIFEPGGKFVYNTKYEVGIRKTPKNLAPNL